MLEHQKKFPYMYKSAKADGHKSVDSAMTLKIAEDNISEAFNLYWELLSMIQTTLLQ